MGSLPIMRLPPKSSLLNCFSEWLEWARSWSASKPSNTRRCSTRGTAAPLGGRLAWEVLERIHPTISVGANEVQRDLIARSALGLSRHRGG